MAWLKYPENEPEIFKVAWVTTRQGIVLKAYFDEEFRTSNGDNIINNVIAFMDASKPEPFKG